MTAFALVALIVGVLVWPTPKEALANERYSVDLKCVEDPLNQHWAAYANVQIRGRWGGVWAGWVDCDVVDGANYFVYFFNAPTDWEVRLTETGIYHDEEDPILTAGGTHNFVWEVSEHDGAH